MSNLNLTEYLRTKPTIALVGASNNSEKFGNRIFLDLTGKGFRCLPVTRRGGEVEGVTAHAGLEAAFHSDSSIGLVVYVVPPSLTLASLADAARLDLKKVWIQPGAGDESVREFLDQNGFEYLMDACVMVQS